MQKTIRYKDIAELDFAFQEVDDPVYYAEFGCKYEIITLDLTKKISLDYEKDKRTCRLIRTDKRGNIKAEMPIRDLQMLKDIFKFYGGGKY